MISEATSDESTPFSRRNFLRVGAGAVLVSVIPMRAAALPTDVAAAREALFGDKSVNEGRVQLTLPPISENGYSVPITIDVESPMSGDNYVERIAVFAERNPLANVAHYTLGSRAGRARVKSRIRLGGTQTITAVAEMNDGTLWSGTADTVVTLAACVIL